MQLQVVISSMRELLRELVMPKVEVEFKKNIRLFQRPAMLKKKIKTSKQKPKLI